ncbi:phage late control D family protein [Azospirillum halopraeferens]|uniref:phage late control D family protein n=1 Tax=Azospirillum halopraeferens TaxID=34010 RepID=UPI00048D4680|nr:contractile injection system protein, VgrG/Pvc8 family [Azospirillum halopraeferens]
MNRVDTPVWTLTWQGTDVTADIAAMVTGLTVTDRKDGESDELAVTLEDRDGRWRGDWLPEKGDVLEATLGYAGGPVVDAGTYQVDEVDHSGPPDRLEVRALAAGVTEALRTRRHRAFEGRTLAQIAAAVAADHGMAVIGDPASEALQRVTQADETDLEFLSKLAAEHGYVFSARARRLVFMSEDELLSADPVMTLSRALHHPVRWRFRVTARQVYTACEVRYLDPATKRTRTVTVKAAGQETKPKGGSQRTGGSPDAVSGSKASVKGDLLRRRMRVESEAHARQKAQALLDRANRGEVRASLTFPGRPDLVAGINVVLAGFGRAWDGTYHVTGSTHRMVRGGGYTTDMEAHRV